MMNYCRQTFDIIKLLSSLSVGYKIYVLTPIYDPTDIQYNVVKFQSIIGDISYFKV